MGSFNGSPSSNWFNNFTTLYNLNGNLTPSNGYNFNDTSTWRGTAGKTYNPLFGSVAAGMGSVAARALSDAAGGMVSNALGDSEIGAAMGNIFSSGISTGANTIADNIIKGNALEYGLGLNVASSLAGSAAGLASNYIGLGLESMMGHSNLGKFTGAAASTGIGTLGGAVASNIVRGINGPIFGSGGINPVALGMSMVGAGLQSALGPSKELAGKHGDITKGFDTAHSIISTGVSFIPGVGQVIAGELALNKGLSNLFGSTDGMTKTDATLAGIGNFIAPVKWANTLGKKTTGFINDESWLKREARDSFAQNRFGDIGSRIDDAMEKAGKTYGTFSHRQYGNAQRDIAFANRAKSMMDDMAVLNEIQNIRSTAMTSVNNQRYQQNIQGGPRLSYIGKQGMKILSKACKDLD